MKNSRPVQRLGFAMFASTCLLVVAIQVGCVPDDSQTTTDLVSTLATEFLNQGLNFVLSFARTGLAAFLF